jgi:hypothetical protein
MTASDLNEGGSLPAAPSGWHCKKCSSPRAIDPCQKCGGTLAKDASGWEWPGLPDIARIRSLAREVGYAVGVHGTMERDLDLIAVPWVAEAVQPVALAQHIAAGLCGDVVDYETQDKPCGRWSCNIHTPGWTKLIDLSVMPPAPPVVPVGEEQRQQIAALIAKPGLFSTDNETAHRAASPYSVNGERDKALTKADAILAALGTKGADHD